MYIAVVQSFQERLNFLKQSIDAAEINPNKVCYHKSIDDVISLAEQGIAVDLAVIANNHGVLGRYSPDYRNLVKLAGELKEKSPGTLILAYSPVLVYEGGFFDGMIDMPREAEHDPERNEGLVRLLTSEKLEPALKVQDWLALEKEFPYVKIFNLFLSCCLDFYLLSI